MIGVPLVLLSQFRRVIVGYDPHTESTKLKSPTPHRVSIDEFGDLPHDFIVALDHQPLRQQRVRVVSPNFICFVCRCGEVQSVAGHGHDPLLCVPIASSKIPLLRECLRKSFSQIHLSIHRSNHRIRHHDWQSLGQPPDYIACERTLGVATPGAAEKWDILSLFAAPGHFTYEAWTKTQRGHIK